MSFDLHQEPFNLLNNLGLYWIWGQILGYQIVDIYKVMMKDEKFSFQKILNVAKENNVEVNYKLLESQTRKFIEEYDKTDIERIRDKYIAHQDIQVPRIEIDLHTICDISQKITALFHLFASEFLFKYSTPSSTIVHSFKEIFYTIDEYELVKAILITEQIRGNNRITISKLSQEIEKYQIEVRKKENK